MPISPYIRQLRERLGRMRLLLPSVSVHVVDAAGRLLLVQQRDGERWSTPGGLIEPGELPADAAVRETWEETGLLVRPKHVVGVYGGPECVVSYPNGDEVQYVITAFDCTVTRGVAQPDGEETLAVQYWTEAEAAELPLAPWLRAHLQLVYSGRSGAGFIPATWSTPERASFSRPVRVSKRDDR